MKNKYLSTILSNPLFVNLTDEEKEILLNGTLIFDYKRNRTIFKERDIPIGMLLMCSGSAKVFKEGVGGREHILRLCSPGDFVGYRALLSGNNHIATAAAIEDSTIATIERETVFKLIRSNSELSINIMQLMAIEIGVLSTRTISHTQKHTRGRLAESLLFIKDKYGFEDDRTTIKVYLSREDLANLSNITTSNTIRELSSFCGEKIIAIDGRKIKILDLEKLEIISEMGQLTKKNNNKLNTTQRNV